MAKKSKYYNLCNSYRKNPQENHRILYANKVKKQAK